MILPTPDSSVIYQALGDGAILFSPTTEIYFGLNRVGSRVWELLPPTSATIDDLCATLAAEYPDAESSTIREDVVELLDRLVAESLATRPPRVSDASADS